MGRTHMGWSTPTTMSCDPEDYVPAAEAIGKGSFGEVVIWKHRSSGEIIVCKKSSFETERDAVFSGILFEWSVGRVLDHPHILRAYGASLTSTSAGILYPRAESGDLLTWIHENGPTTTQIQTILVQILDALAYLDRLDIVHGDIKPQNVLIFNDVAPHIQLADFGLAHFVLRNSAHQPVPRCAEIQTLWYRPPELLLHQALGAFYAQYETSIDIWAFGCLAFECVTQKPFVASNTAIGMLSGIRKHVGWYAREEAVSALLTCYAPSSGPHTGVHRLFARHDASVVTSERIASIECPVVRDVVSDALVIEASDRSSASELLTKFQTIQHTPTLTSLAASLRQNEHYYCEEEHQALLAVSSAQRQRSIKCIAQHCREFREHPLIFFVSMELLDRFLARVQTFDDLLPTAVFHLAQLAHSESGGSESLVDSTLIDHLHRCEERILKTIEYQVVCTNRFHWFEFLLRTLHPADRPLTQTMLTMLYASIDDVNNTIMNNPKEVALVCIRTARVRAVEASIKTDAVDPCRS